MKMSNYMTRALRSKDRRYSLVLGKLGHVEPLKSPTDVDPLDHDRDGRRGGSLAPEGDGDLPALRAEYHQVVGRRPFSGWDAQVLREKIAAARNGN